MDLPKGRPNYDQNKDYYLELLEAEQTILELKKEINNLKDKYQMKINPFYTIKIEPS